MLMISARARILHISCPVDFARRHLIVASSDGSDAHPAWDSVASDRSPVSLKSSDKLFRVMTPFFCPYRPLCLLRFTTGCPERLFPCQLNPGHGRGVNRMSLNVKTSNV